MWGQPGVLNPVFFFKYLFKIPLRQGGVNILLTGGLVGRGRRGPEPPESFLRLIKRSQSPRVRVHLSHQLGPVPDAPAHETWLT